MNEFYEMFYKKQNDKNKARYKESLGFAYTRIAAIAHGSYYRDISPTANDLLYDAICQLSDIPELCIDKKQFSYLKKGKGDLDMAAAESLAKYIERAESLIFGCRRETVSI